MTKEKKVISYHGILITHSGETFYLLDNQPRDREIWMNDNERMFLGFEEDGVIQPIIVSGYTLLPSRKGMAHARVEEEEAQLEIDEEELEKLFSVTTIS